MSRDHHKRFRPAFADRQAARHEFMSLQGLDELFAAEARGLDWEVEDDDA